MQYLCSFILLVILFVVPASAQQSSPPLKIEIDANVDRFPNGCVDCHVQLPDRDVRISSAMKQWSERVHPGLLARAKAVAPAGMELKGQHPKVEAADVPAACLSCHGRESKVAPAFGKLLHSIHLTGGESNHYVTMFGGACTHCHKVDFGTGAMTLASGSEKK